MFVQPLNGTCVFLPRLSNNPHDYTCIKAGRIGDDLAKVIVVGLFQLILNQHRFPGQLIFADDIAAITAYKLFSLNVCQRKI